MSSERRLAVLPSNLTATSHRPPRVHARFEDGLIIRDMTPSDAKTVVGWFSESESQSLDELEITMDVFDKAENAYFVVGEKDGELISSVMWVPWTPSVVYFGYHFVVDKYRSRGYGKLMYNFFGERTVGKAIAVLDSIPGNSKHIIQKGKYKYFEDYIVDVICGIPLIPSGIPSSSTLSVVPYTAVDWAKVVQYYDAHFCLVDSVNAHLRHQFLARWCAIQNGRAYVALNGDTVVGLGCRRPCVTDHQLGPLYADNELAAEMLMGALCRDLPPSETITFYVSDLNQKSLELMKKFGLKIIDTYTRVYLHGKIDSLKDDVYVMTSADVCGF